MLFLIIHDLFNHDIEWAITTCLLCSHIGQQKKLVTWRCISFVHRFNATFCCSLWTSCRQMGTQSYCASSHCKCKFVDKAVLLAVGRHGRRVSDAIVIFHIVLTIWQGHSLYYFLSFASHLRISHLESSIRTACFPFPAYICHLHCTLNR